MTAYSGGQESEDLSVEFSAEELQEFLDADQIEVHANPEFKERLRLKLWEYLRKRYTPGSDES